MAFLPPGGPTEIVFSFDTTGSMSAILEEVQSRLQDMIQRLQSDIPGIRISVIAHGDYCDAEHFYVTKHMDFCDSIPDLCAFVNDVGGTGGGDVPECYELVLRMVREQLSWQPMSQKILIMIGDAYPHEPDFPENTLNIDWRDEITELTKMGVRIYGVQVGDDETSRDFFETLATDGGGQYLKLENFSNICTFIMAICYRERGDDFLLGFEAEVRAGKGKATIGKDLEGLFGTLRRDDSMASSVSGPSTLKFPTPVSPISSFTDTPKVKAVKAKPKPKKRHVIVKKTANKVTVKRASKKMESLRREKVTETNFAFRDYQWSKWHLALVSSTEKDLPGVWERLKSGVGLKRKCINLSPKSNKQSNTFVEVSVQPRPHAKRHVVLFKVLHGKLNPTTWYRSVFSKRKVKVEVQRVLGQGCKVFVRSAVMKKSKRSVVQETRDISGRYDYAWQNSQNHRDLYLRKYDVHIADNTI